VNSNKVPEKYIKLFLDLSSNKKQLGLITSQIHTNLFYEKISRRINSKNINNFFALIVSTKECSDYIKIKYGSEFFNEIENLAENELYSFEKINAENNSEYDGLDNPDE